MFEDSKNSSASEMEETIHYILHFLFLALRRYRQSFCAKVSLLVEEAVRSTTECFDSVTTFEKQPPRTVI